MEGESGITRVDDWLMREMSLHAERLPPSGSSTPAKIHLDDDSRLFWGINFSLLDPGASDDDDSQRSEAGVSRDLGEDTHNCS